MASARCARLVRYRILTERDGIFYVGIERVEQIVRLDYRRDGFKARAEPIKVPPDFKPSNTTEV